MIYCINCKKNICSLCEKNHLNHELMPSIVSIENIKAMEDKKMLIEDVIEEHNGVYGGKWHIVSIEGFDLPEGLEYLRNNASDSYYEARSDIEIYAIVVVNNIEIENAFREILRVLYENRAYGISLTFKNCYSPSVECFFNFQRVNKLSFHVKELILNGVNITFEDLGVLLNVTHYEELYYTFNEVVFEKKDWKFLEQVKKFYNSCSKRPFKFCKFQNCNFTEEEIAKLKVVLGNCNLIV